MLIYILNALLYASYLFLIAAGLSLIFGVMGIINLTHGCLFMLGAYTAITMFKLLGGFESFPMALLSIFIASLIVGVVGLALERFFICHIYEREDTYQLLLTYGLVFILEDIVRLKWGFQPLYAHPVYKLLGSINIGGVFYPVYNFIVIIGSWLVALMLWFLLFKTKVGKIIRATSMDREMASAIGVNIRNVYISTFLFGSILGGLSGALMVPIAGAVLGMDVDVLIEAFVVIVIGGLGSIKGALLGAIIVGAMHSIGIALFPEIELALIYLIMAIILVIRPQGLFGKKLTR